MSVRRIDNAGASITIAPYEHPLVWEFVGKGRYLQAAFCRSVAQLYSAKFGTLTAKDLSNFAAHGAFLGLLEWFNMIGCRWDESVFVSGASGGSVVILDWLLNNCCPFPEDAAACTAAAVEGHVEALKFLHSCECFGDDETYAAAAKNGHLNVLQFAQQFRCEWNAKKVCLVAAEHGHIHILPWMHETLHIDELFSVETCESAGYGGRIEVLTWRRSVGCPWDAETCWSAIDEGHLHVLRWAVDEGCPWTLHDRLAPYGLTGLLVAVDKRHAEIVTYLINRGANLDAPDNYGFTPLSAAAHEGKVEIVNLLITAGADVNIGNENGVTPLGIALREDQQEIAEILRAAGGRE